MSDNPYLKGKVPARYTGEHEIILAGFGRPYFDADGKMLEDLQLRHGDTLYITEEEARGVSWLHDPARQKESLRIGTGKCVPDHPDYLGKSESDLMTLGWEYHAARSDFEEIVKPEDPQKEGGEIDGNPTHS
jgi:hypothetical protein